MLYIVFVIINKVFFVQDVKPKRKEKIQKPAKWNTNMVGEEFNLDTTQIPPPPEPLNSEDIQTFQTNNEISNLISEIAQAVNTIINDQQPQDVEFGSSPQVHHTLSVATGTGEQLLFCMFFLLLIIFYLLLMKVKLLYARLSLGISR